MSFDFVDAWLKLSFHFFLVLVWISLGDCYLVRLYVFAVFLQFDSSVFLFLFSLLAYYNSVNKNYYYYRISSKLVHAFGLQTPITAKFSMHGCKATVITMATASWQTCRRHDGMQPPKFRPNRSTDRRVIAFPTFCNTAAVRHLEFEFCHSGPPTKSTRRFSYSVDGLDPIFAVKDIAISWFCQFGWEIQPRPLVFFLGGGGWTP